MTTSTTNSINFRQKLLMAVIVDRLRPIRVVFQTGSSSSSDEDANSMTSSIAPRARKQMRVKEAVQ